jgi:hypothetical protein
MRAISSGAAFNRRGYRAVDPFKPIGLAVGRSVAPSHAFQIDVPLHRLDNGGGHQGRSRVMKIRKPGGGRRIGTYSVEVDQVRLYLSWSSCMN